MNTSLIGILIIALLIYVGIGLLAVVLTIPYLEEFEPDDRTQKRFMFEIFLFGPVVYLLVLAVALGGAIAAWTGLL